MIANRTHRQILALLLALAFGCLYLIYAYDVFVDESLDTVSELRIELDEALLYGAGMTLVFSSYALMLFRSRRRQQIAQAATIAEARRTGETDVLTGLANRRGFDAALEGMLAGSAEAGWRRDALLMIDLNGFKPVNDRYGHAAGDELLKVVGARLNAAVRSGDLVARIGGDEFAILAPDVGSRATAAAIAERVLANLAEPIVVAGAVHRIGAGIGIALAPGDGFSARELSGNADAALYRAKRTGAGTQFHERAA